jgi:hypothetical protein
MLGSLWRSKRMYCVNFTENACSPALVSFTDAKLLDSFKFPKRHTFIRKVMAPADAILYGMYVDSDHHMYTLAHGTVQPINDNLHWQISCWQKHA